jgi:hypothetical protein
MSDQRITSNNQILIWDQWMTSPGDRFIEFTMNILEGRRVEVSGFCVNPDPTLLQCLWCATKELARFFNTFQSWTVVRLERAGIIDRKIVASDSTNELS